MSGKKSKRYTCKWEPDCDDDCRRPYGDCPDNCPNYKENKSVEELEKEIAVLEEQNRSLTESLDIMHKRVTKLKLENDNLKNFLNNDIIVNTTAYIRSVSG